jgi:hypothetical protein
MSDSEPDVPPPPKEKRKCTDKQLENLRAGMAKLKTKRETLAKEREEFEAKKSKGDVPADAPKPKFVPEPKKPKVVKVSAPAPEPQVIQVERKKRTEKAKIAVDDVKGELASLRAELSALKKPAEIKEVVKEVEKIVDRPVVTTKMLSGSDLLNQIFFSK